MPEEQRIENGEVHPKFWEKTVKEAFKNDSLRIIIELIKNSADSYTRLGKEGKLNPPFQIFVKVFCKKKSPPYIEVRDNAGGMNSEKLKEALKYGAQTSMGEDIESITSAEKGIGLKDAMMALEDNWLITIQNGLINERNKHPDFRTGIGKEDKKVTEEQREKLQIPDNGTVVTGELPDYFRDRKFATICERLQEHFLMRKLLQYPNYKIYVIDGKSKEKKLLEYRPPKIEKQILKETFKINYNGEDYPIHLIINRSKEELLQGKPYNKSGLLFFYGKYSVVDFTFCRYDRDLSFSKFFGEVQIEIERLIKDPDEAPLVDEKRKGLVPEHPFNRVLFNKVSEILKGIQEEEETSKYSVDEDTKREILKEINRIYKEIKGKGVPPKRRLPIEPETFAFYPVYISMMEYEPKTSFLIINSSIISDNLEITLSSTNPDIIVKRPIIKIDKDIAEDEFIVRQIELYSEKAKSKGEIIATSNLPIPPEKMGVEVLENPIFSPTNGFAFVPDKTTVVDGSEKKVQLYIDKSVIGDSKEITLASESPINCAGKWILPNIENLGKYIIKNIVRIEIPIKVVGTGHIGKQVVITALYENKVSKLNIKVISEPSGMLRDIRPSGKDTKEISKFIEDEGILEIYYKHPLIKKYMTQKNFRIKLDFLVFVADTITREIIRAFVLSGYKEGSSGFRIFDIDHPEPEIDDHVIREYYEQGPRMHEMFIKLARTFKVGD